MPAKIQKWKTDILSKLNMAIKNSKVMAVVNIDRVPSPQLQEIRRALRNKGSFFVSKNTLLSIALNEAEQTKKNISTLTNYITGSCGLFFSNENPFKLYKYMESIKTKAPAKGGEIAPTDIVVKEGETSFKPGPIVGELQKVGIKAAIEKGKVVIKKDSLVVKQGQPIPKDVAIMLTRLEIFPVTIGLNLKAVYEDGFIYLPDTLRIDEDRVLNDFRLGFINGLNLSLELSYPTKLNIGLILSRAYRNAYNLALNSSIITRETIEPLILKAYRNMLAIKSLKS